VEILSFLGAIEEYSYIDRIGNAIDEISVLEALKDAVRAYYTNCMKEKKCVEYNRELKLGVYCPDVKPEELDQIISSISARVGKVSRIELIKLSRELALKAYARIPEVRKRLECKAG